MNQIRTSIYSLSSLFTFATHVIQSIFSSTIFLSKTTSSPLYKTMQTADNGETIANPLKPCETLLFFSLSHPLSTQKFPHEKLPIWLFFSISHHHKNTRRTHTNSTALILTSLPLSAPLCHNSTSTRSPSHKTIVISGSSQFSLSLPDSTVIFKTELIYHFSSSNNQPTTEDPLQ